MRSILSWALALCLVAVSNQRVFAAEESDPGTKAPQTRQEKIKMFEKMAKTHQEAADCLKAGKTEAECKAEISKNCPMMTEKGECPMAEMMFEGKHMGKMHMRGSEEKKAKKGTTTKKESTETETKTSE